MARRYKPGRSYDLFGIYSWYTPGIGGLLLFALMFLLGIVLASIVGIGLQMAGMEGDSFNLIVYVTMFIPVMIYSAVVSRNNALWDKGYKIDNNSHFAPYGGFVMAVMAVIAMICTGLAIDPVNNLIAENIPMSDMMKEALEGLVGGNFILNFLSVCVFAPLFEEWMCRGVILRSLLLKIRPVWAVIISALVFALIHGNIWQGVNAFALGLLLGYVYYKTGSLKLTILMHFTNNFISLLLSQSSAMSQYESWADVMPSWAYWTAVGASAIILVGTIAVFRKVPVEGRLNCDEISAEEFSAGN